MRVLVTGSSGFIGGNLFRFLEERKHDVFGVVRRESLSGGRIFFQDIYPDTDWSFILSHQFDVIIHCAALAHRKGNEQSMYDVNYKSTVNFFRQAAKAGVGQFVFISSVAVYGSQDIDIYSELTATKPDSDYGKSKRLAEQGLQELSGCCNMSVTIIRPPMVYGVDAPGNLNILGKFIKKGIPLPFLAINNRRSSISIEKLCEFVCLLLDRPLGTDHIFLIADNIQSTPSLVRRLASDLGVDVVLFPVPVLLLRLVGRLLGKKQVIESLCGDFIVDGRKAKEVLDWPG